MPASPGYDFGWMDQIVRFIGAETAEGRPGAEQLNGIGAGSAPLRPAAV